MSTTKKRRDTAKAVIAKFTTSQSDKEIVEEIKKAMQTPPRKISEGLRQAKKIKSPEEPAHESGAKADEAPAAFKIPRDRLISCPDNEHHLESEMLDRLEAFFSITYQYEAEGDSRFSENIILEAAARSSSYVLEDAPTHAPLLSNNNAIQGRIFEGKSRPKISVKEYLQRLVFYLTSIAEFERKNKTDPSVHSDLAIRYLIAAIIYLERIEQMAHIQVNAKNVHRLLITGCLIAAKVLDDIQPNMQYFADLGGVSVGELAKMEWAFVELVSYKIQIMPETFLKKYKELLDINLEHAVHV